MASELRIGVQALRQLKQCQSSVAQLVGPLKKGDQAHVCIEAAGLGLEELTATVHALYNSATTTNPFVRFAVIPQNEAGGPLLPADKPSDRGFKTFPHVALGGTFDRMHNGHRMFLTHAAMCATERLRVGITTQEMLTTKKFAEMIQPIEERIASVVEFLKLICPPEVHLDVVQLEEFTGGTKSIADVGCMVITPDTLRAGEKCNELRAENGLPPMVIEVAPLVDNSDQLAEDCKLSSSLLRQFDYEALQKTKAEGA